MIGIKHRKDTPRSGYGLDEVTIYINDETINDSNSPEYVSLEQGRYITIADDSDAEVTFYAQDIDQLLEALTYIKTYYEENKT